MSLIPPYYHLQDVSTNDIIVASIAFGFNLGFGVLTAWHSAQQTWLAYKNTGLRVFRNIYIWMIWGEIVVCLAFAIICFLYLRRIIKPSFAFYFLILTLWALQVHFLLQIIINRCRLVALDKRLVWRLKVGVAILITAVNISVYCLWIPARLQVSHRYIHINNYWDRCEKVIYMIVDGLLNLYFVRVVQRGLVRNGLTKYRGLVHFNMFIIGFSLSMDLLIITMMSLPNTFVYMQFHPLAYIVKLNIELSMADLIARIARSRDNAVNDIGLTRNDSSATKLSRLRSTGTSASGSIPDRRKRSFGLGGWNLRGISAGDDFNRLTRPTAVYTVNATASADITDIESVIGRGSRDIYRTREYRVDYEDMSSGSHGGSMRDSNTTNTTGTTMNENDEAGLLQQKD